MASETAPTPWRDLHTGRSLWDGSRGSHFPAKRLEGDLQVEVAIVGAGISGACLAYALRARGNRVAVLDRRPPLRGSTLASTALLAFELDVPLTVLGTEIGRNAAERAWRRSLEAVRALRSIVRRERFRCGFSDRNSLYLAGDAYGARTLEAEAAARARARIPGSFLDAGALHAAYGLDRTGAIESSGSAVANPAQLAAGFLRRAGAAGVRIHAPAEVTAVESSRSGVTLAIGSRRVVRAGAVVFCTGYELLQCIPFPRHQVQSTWVVATAPHTPMPSWLKRTTVWEASDPYLYVRSTADGRLIAGGEDEGASERHVSRRLLRKKSETIAAKVEGLIPDLSVRPARRWGGTFGESPTGLPVIDRVRGIPHCFVVAGFGGNGITYAVMAAQVIPRLLGGQKDPDADLYRMSS